ncbi:MAG: RcpC/CpaB family pilus assembly protein [Pseudomonadota bacterium]
MQRISTRVLKRTAAALAGLLGVLLLLPVFQSFTGDLADRIGSDIFENETQELAPEQTTDRLERGERAISVVADQGDGIVGFLRSGDRVDLYLEIDEGTQLITSGGAIRLIAISESEISSRPGKLLTFAVDPTMAARIALAQNAGRIRVALRGAGDSEAGGELIAVEQTDLLGIEEEVVEEARQERICTVRTRRGSEVTEIEIPCPASSNPTKKKKNQTRARVDAIVSELRDADLAFNRPDEMILGQTTTVELVLAPDEVAALDQLPKDADISTRAEAIGLSADLSGTTRVVEDVEYALKMQATLAGLDFIIDPPGPQRRTLLDDRSAKWVWTVEPKSHGPGKVLNLTVGAIVAEGGTDLPPIAIKTFSEKILVNVTLWDQAVGLAKEVTALHGVIVAVGGALVAVLGWLRARLRTDERADHKPAEVIVTHKIAADETGDA